MLSYQAPLADFQYLLQEVFDYERVVSNLPGLGDASVDLVMAVLDGAGELAVAELVPINLQGDISRCTWTPDGVKTPPGYSDAYAAYRDGGWPSLAADPAHGGQGLPASLSMMVREVFAAGSMAFAMYGGLSQSAYRAILAHGSDQLKDVYLPRLADGEWTGTMCLTEAESGSDLSQLRTKAVPAEDGSFHITGTKIFISGGDHDLTNNIVHLVLARLPNAPPGIKGLSLFLVPKFVPDRAGSVDQRQANGVICQSIEHKMGIAGSATATLRFEGSKGWLVGEADGGLKAMFTMMNSSRVGVAVQSVGVAEMSLQNARRYATERLQGRAPRAADNREQRQTADPIVRHPDVKRMLLTMRALVEGSRALYVESAMELDVRARHPDARARAAADNALALMTPVLKSFISDCAVETTRLGLAVHGGHGYIRDTGMEQLLRDALIVPLYEGTNGIQALDLVQRKLNLDEGATMQSFLSRVGQTIADARSEPQVTDLSALLAVALEHLRDTTAVIQERSRSDPPAAAASASDFARLFGLVACGNAWLRMATRASRGGAAGASFYARKLATARFYLRNILPQTGPLCANVMAEPATIAQVHEEEI